MQYKTFISYNKAADRELAPCVRKALEQIAKPVFKRKAINVFLDSSSLTATPDLWESIQEGLKKSEYCVFLASPGSAKSPWCIKELKYWQANKNADKLFLLWTHGELKWDHITNNFNWEITTAFPRELDGLFKAEPLYIDMREQYAKEQFTLNNPAFKNNMAMIAAPMHSMPLEELIDEDIKQHKKTIWLRNGAIGLLSALFILALVLAIFARKQKQLAEENAALAIKQSKIAVANANEATFQAGRVMAKSYLANSKANERTDPTLALKLAFFGYNFVKDDKELAEEFKDQIVSVFNNNEYFYGNLNDKIPATNIKTKQQYQTEMNGYKLLENENGAIVLFHNEKQLKTIINSEEPISNFGFTKNGNFIIVESQHQGYKTAIDLYVFDKLGNLLLNTFTFNDAAQGIALNAVGNIILITGEKETGIAWIEDENTYGYSKINNNNNITAFTISKSGNFVLLGYDDGLVNLYEFDFEIGAIRRKHNLNGHNSESISMVVFSADEKFAISQSARLKRKWQLNVPRPFVELESTFSISPSTLFNDGRVNSYEIDKTWPPVVAYIYYLNQKGDTVAKFKDPINYLFVSKSPDGKYTATSSGLYNQKQEKLFELAFINTTEHENHQICGFSTDGKYYFAQTKIYFLDPENIMQRFNSIYGTMEPFTDSERRRYSIIGEKLQ
jgi:WD40 repeat protein